MGPSLRFLALMQLLFGLSLFHLTVANFTSFTPPICQDDDRSALWQFKEGLIITCTASGHPSAYPKTASWKLEEENGDCCKWDGVTCNEFTGHVIKLNLTSSCLYGSINSNSSLFHLVHLHSLNLADNYFNRSRIPSKISSLLRLSYLDLSYSAFYGLIPPEILQLSKLVYLDLSENPLELQNPGLQSLAENLTSLTVLNLNQVNIFSSIPSIFTNLSSLIYLSLEECALQGEFPEKIFQLSHLHFLNVQYNIDLTGYLPEFVRYIPLQELRLEYTSFSGFIPRSVGYLKSLTYLSLRLCLFSGTIPSSLGNLTQINYLDFSHNDFSGEMPSSIRNLDSLEVLNLSYNNFSSQNTSSLSWIASLNKLGNLQLSGINLVEEIPNWLLNLTQLTLLDMSGNELTGPIPNWLMNLHKLTVLGLSSNRLAGLIPFEIKNLTRLEVLDIGSNRLEGPVPGSITELKNLSQLDLSSNNLSGILDLNMFLLKLESLGVLVLSSNNLSLLTEINVTDFRELYVLGFGSCNLSVFPSFLQKQERLESLDLSSNKIVGQIPRWLLDVGTDSLQYLNLSYNLLIGFDQNPVVLPWTREITLDLRSNKLQGPLPIPSVSTIAFLVSENQLTGKIKPWICSLNRLYALDLSYNNLSGKLPKCLGNFSYQLAILQLQGNKFHGSIPQIFWEGISLRMIDLSHNQLEGRIPRSLVNCKMLKFLNLGSNRIIDIFPSWLGTLPELQVLILKLNKFHGVIKEPVMDVEFPKLRIIDLSHNRFKGTLPSKYFQCWKAMQVVNARELTYMQEEIVPDNLPIYTPYGPYGYSLTLSNKGIEMEYGKLSNFITAIILSNNEFVGEVPPSIGSLKGLHNLNLSKNNLQGHIPSSLGNLTVLESLDLSNNWFSGEIPQQLAELTSLEVFNVSHNHLTGRIPQGKQFSTFGSSSFDGNPGLCGEPLSKKCENSEPKQNEEQEIEDSGSLFEFGWKTVLTGFASGTIAGVVLGHTFGNAICKWLGHIFGLRIGRSKRTPGQRNVN